MVLQINSAPLSQWPLGLHNDFHNQNNSLILATGAAKLYLDKLAPEYAELVAQENSVVKRQTAYVSTATLESLDEQRDHMVRILLGTVDYQVDSTIAAKASAARVLQALCAPYRNVARSDYRTQTREVNGLIALLSGEEEMAHLTTLNLTEELAEVVRLNALFDIAIQEKQGEAVERMPQTTLTTDELRKALDAKYAEIVQTVNAYAVVQPSAEIESYITNLNAVIMLVKQSAATQGKKKEEEESKDESEAPETPENSETPETPEAPEN